MEEIGVSILCPTYNQEKYIRQSLEGFVMQKTNFPFEVIVHDDASTDKTPKIIKEYAEKYPNIIKPIYQKENQYSKGVQIIVECLFPKARGKYLAFCEGDDFWIDENKLQLQYDIMEKNSNCHFCFHTVRAIFENGKKMNRTYPNFNLQQKLMSAEEVLKIICLKDYSIQTSSYFLRRNDYKNYITDFMKIRQIFRRCGIGDQPILLYFSSLDKIYYINKVMSKYRVNSLGNWSSIHTYKEYKRFHCYIEAMEEFDKYTSYKYHRLCILRMLKLSVLIARFNPNRKELLFKNRKEFFGRFNLFQKLVLLMYVLFPSLATQLRKIYRFFKY